ncbi:MAG: hypothetical protein QOH66_2643 [Actinomycetota bacterium]|jgi:hypothetical protein|nr:hypothetical protein [Actinomycetota bacterium]
MVQNQANRRLSRVAVFTELFTEPRQTAQNRVKLRGMSPRAGSPKSIPHNDFWLQPGILPRHLDAILSLAPIPIVIQFRPFISTNHLKQFRTPQAHLRS